MCATFEKNLFMGFRDKSFFLHKVKVALNPIYRIFTKLLKCFSCQLTKYIENKNFLLVSYIALNGYMLLALNGPK